MSARPNWICALFVLYLQNYIYFTNSSPNFWDLPVLPRNISEDPSMIDNVIPKKNIPRHLWMAFKTVPPENEMAGYLKTLINKNNQTWRVHMIDNDGQLRFMETYFANTSALWAFKQIHPMVGNSAADIWRYAVLYIHGGLYMDDDSFLNSPFDQIVHPEDTLILSKERNPYADDCYRSWYKLSYAFLKDKYNATNKVTDINGGRTLVSWAVFASPRHPIIRRTLENIVDLIRHEYLLKSAITISATDVKWKICMCATGPVALTASAREVILEKSPVLHQGPRELTHDIPAGPGDTPGVQLLRVVLLDYHDYGGVFKMNRGHNPHHYMHTMQKQNLALLRSYWEGPSEGSKIYGSLMDA